MIKIITLVGMMLIYMLPALTAPAYATNHAKDEATTIDADDNNKKVDEEDEEPECD